MALYDGFGYKINFEVASADIDALNGKTIIFMGDSYTAQAKNQFAALAEKYGAVADNRGVASSSICGNLENTKGLYPMWNRTVKVCQEYIDAGTTGNVGAVVFMGGANDAFSQSTWLGTGTNNKDTEHIYGALHKIFKTFHDTFDCPIFVILQPYFPKGVGPDPNADESNVTGLWGFDSMEQYLSFDALEYCAYSMEKKQRVVKQMAEFYNCIIIDCCFNWHSIFNASDLAKYWSGDGHPTSDGYQAIADDLELALIKYFG